MIRGSHAGSWPARTASYRGWLATRTGRATACPYDRSDRRAMMDPEEAFDSFPASTRRRRRLGTFALSGALVTLVVALAVGALAYQSHRSGEEVPATSPV